MNQSSSVSAGWSGRLTATLVYLMCLTPLFCLAERLLRAGESHPLLGHHLLETLVVIFLIPPLAVAVAIKWWLIVLVPPLLAAALVYCLRHRPYSVRCRRLLRGLARFALAIAALAGAAFWWFFTALQPELAAAVGVPALAGFGFRGGKTKRRRLLFTLLLGMLGAAGVYGGYLWEFRRAAPLEPTVLYDRPSFDAAVLADGTLLALDDHQAQAMVGHPGSLRPVDYTTGPQRLAVDPADQTTYLANYDGSSFRAVVAVEQGQGRAIRLPGCRKTIDVALAPENRLLALCEYSGSLHVYDLSARRVERVLRVPRYPYALAVDAERKRVYLTTEMWSGGVRRVDLDSGKITASRNLGRVNWGAVYDARRRLVWVARPIVGEVVALDENLKVQKRIRVGGAPRDLALDPVRDLLLAGNYFSGTLAVVEPESGRLLRRLRADRPGLWHQLRGVSLAPDGAWLVANGAGVWRLEPDDILD